MRYKFNCKIVPGYEAEEQQIELAIQTLRDAGFTFRSIGRLLHISWVDVMEFLRREINEI